LETVLTGDIGGTNARFALFRDGQFIESSLRKLPVANNPDLADTIAAYIAEEDASGVCKIALSVASTAEYCDFMELTNNNVSFKVSDLVARFGLQQGRVVNDFTAAALGVVELPEQNLQTIHTGITPSIVDTKAPKAVLGAGTGLGVSGLIYSGSHWIPLQGQGGHVTMVAQTERELAIRNVLAKKLGHVSAERYLSGPGTVGVYHAICELDGVSAKFTDAEEISSSAINNSCDVCTEVMELFCKYLGVVAGDLAVTLGSEGGIYIAGGIVPHLGEYFTDSEFLQWLHYKGRFSEFVKDMPVRLVTGGEPALFGAYQSLKPYYNSYGYTVHAC